MAETFSPTLSNSKLDTDPGNNGLSPYKSGSSNGEGSDDETILLPPGGAVLPRPLRRDNLVGLQPTRPSRTLTNSLFNIERVSPASVSETESVTAPRLHPSAPSNRPSIGNGYATVKTRLRHHGLPMNESFGSLRSLGADSNDPMLARSALAANPGSMPPSGIPAPESNASPNDSSFAQYSGSQQPSVYRGFDPVSPAGIPDFFPNNTARRPTAILSNWNGAHSLGSQYTRQYRALAPVTGVKMNHLPPTNPSAAPNHSHRVNDPSQHIQQGPPPSSSAFHTLVQQILTLTGQGWTNQQISNLIRPRGWPHMGPDEVYTVWSTYKDEAQLQPEYHANHHIGRRHA